MIRNTVARWVCAWAAGVLAVAASASADVRLPRVFSDHMVLQRDVPAAIWGWADPGEKVTVRLGEKEFVAETGSDGKWAVKLTAMPAGGPHTITISAKNKIELQDVLFGEVWICSGQSNMDMGIKGIKDAQKEIASAKYPQIRLLWVPYKTAPEPLDDADVSWLPCSPENIVVRGFFNSGFSAAGYFFGRELHRELKVPVGLVHTAFPATRIEPWTPREGFALDPQFSDAIKQIDKATPDFNKAVARTIADIEAWVPKAKAAQAAGKKVTPPPEWPKHALDNNAQPTGLYNAMIHPLSRCSIRGAIWYQGEGNLKDGALYRDRMNALIGGWRKVWGQGDFPFYFVQLAPFHYEEAPDLLPRLWEAQTAALAVPNTGMAVIVDIGDLKDIHPKNKQEVGHRLALWALAKTYGKEGVEYSGPMYKSMKVEGSTIRIQFEHTGGGLASRDGKPLTWFEIAGADKKFVKAEAAIDGNTVVVRADSISEPAAVRFGWSQEAEPNLMNKEGLPVSPFRTDKW